MKINQYIKLDSIIHDLNSGLKYLTYIIVALSLPFMSLRNELALIVLINIFVLLAHIPLGYFTKKLWIVPIFALMSSIFILIFPNVGWTLIIIVAIKVYIMFAFLMLVVMTTPMNDFTMLTYFLCSKFFKKEQAQQYTLVVMLVINFIPIFVTEITKINMSMKAKGITLLKGGMMQKIRNLIIFFKILLYRIDNLIDEYDLILHGRNINISNVDNISEKQRVSYKDIIFTVLCLVIIYF